MTRFDEFFSSATGLPPHPFQRRLAAEGLPLVLEVPPGSGKTAIVLAWLWRLLLHPDPSVRAQTPRRLIFGLPMRGLAEQVTQVVEMWRDNLTSAGLIEDIAVHVVMGGAGRSQQQWRRDAHKPAVVIGTIDSLVSKALVRGYGISRSMYPLDFALVTNGAHWVLDEVQLCGPAATTLRQVEAFAGTLGTAEPLGATYMTATVPWSLLDTVDAQRPTDSQVHGLTAADRTGDLGHRLAATRAIRRLHVEPGDAEALATAVADLHRPGTRTLVIVNTVKSAKATMAALVRLKLDAELVLLHSRFRAGDRERHVKGLMAEVAPDGPGRIAVSTQVVEAGIDVDSATLLTEVAPWSSIVQRAGRCNRYGKRDDAQLWWLQPKTPAPYPELDLSEAAAALDRLEGCHATTSDLLGQAVEESEPAVTVLRRRDLLALFDTAPDLSGNDVDVAPYIRDSDDLDVAIAWATWEGKGPDAGTPVPHARARCPVPIGEASVFAKAKTHGLWRLDVTTARWSPVNPAAPLRPGEVVLANAANGGYDPQLGWEPSSSRRVDVENESTVDVADGREASYYGDEGTLNHGRWVPLDEHLRDTERHARGLTAFLKPQLEPELVEAVAVASRLHDIGKSHPTWQDALCRLARPDEQEHVQDNRPWAKSPKTGSRLHFEGRTGFRHEFASLLLLLDSAAHLLDGIAEPDLVRYLVVAHHGKVRLQVRDPAATEEDGVLGVQNGDQFGVPALLGNDVPESTVDLSMFSLGGMCSWTRTALELRDRFGPFRLAYLESLVRVADWRASAEMEKAR